MMPKDDWGKLKAKFELREGEVRFKKCKQLFEYQHLLLHRNI